MAVEAGVAMNAAHYRRAIVEAVIARLLPIPTVRACFEGGSAATGRLDDYSDIDLVIVAPLAAADEAFDAVEAALAPHGISHVWRVEPPSFPDTAQRFYFLADAPRPDEILLAMAVADGGRLRNRCGSAPAR